MTAALLSDPRAIRRAAIRATLAPSVHNTQPWRFVLSATALEIRADWDRQLRVLDPRGRQLLISCGCAVFNARVALAAHGYAATVGLFADGSRPDLVARLTLPEARSTGLAIAALESMIDHRRTGRGRIADELVPPEVIAGVVAGAREQGAELLPVLRAEHRLAAARLSRLADDTESLDPAYRAELRAWTRDDVTTETYDETNQCLLLLGTSGDRAVDWVTAGGALERVLLELARSGYAASPFTQVIELAAINAALREELQLTGYPQVLLRVGRASATPASRRRRLVDMLEEAR